jgi:hypothetical protein
MTEAKITLSEFRDDLARLIAEAIFHPQPDMSGDIWKRLLPHQRRRCEDAADACVDKFTSHWRLGR